MVIEFAPTTNCQRTTSHWPLSASTAAHSPAPALIKASLPIMRTRCATALYFSQSFFSTTGKLTGWPMAFTAITRSRQPARSTSSLICAKVRAGMQSFSVSAPMPRTACAAPTKTSAARYRPFCRMQSGPVERPRNCQTGWRPSRDGWQVANKCIWRKPPDGDCSHRGAKRHHLSAEHGGDR